MNNGVTQHFLNIEKKYGRKAMLEEMARGGIETNAEFEEGASPDVIYHNCYKAAFDFLVGNGIPIEEAETAAIFEATKYAQP